MTYKGASASANCIALCILNFFGTAFWTHQFGLSMRSPYPVLHNVTDASYWPSPVKQIAQVLIQALPSYLATGPYPFVSVRAFGLLNELSESPLLRVKHNVNNEPLHLNPLADVFDTVLSTVSELRDLTRMEDYGCPRPTIPLWSSLIQTLGSALSEDLSVL